MKKQNNVQVLVKCSDQTKREPPRLFPVSPPRPEWIRAGK